MTSAFSVKALRFGLLISGFVVMGLVSAQAESAQRVMANALEQAGFHEFEERRHEVTVSDCTMTTYVYEDWGEHEKVLWSSFQFDIRFARLMDRQEDGRRYLWSPVLGNGHLALTTFKMVSGTFARHEMAARRNPKPPFETSPREGPDDYVYKDKVSFFILHEGYEEPDKPDQFASLFEQYRTEFCLPLG